MNEQADILVTLSTFGEHSGEPIQMLEQSCLSFRLNALGRRMKPDEVVEAGHRCRGLIVGVENYSDKTLSRMPDLKCISRCGTGIDNIDLKAAEHRGIAILNTPDEPPIAVAELTIAMMLSLMRRLPEVDALMHSKQWLRIPGNLLYGKTIGIIGLGRIGKRVAELVAAFESKVIGFDPYPDEAWLRRNAVEHVHLRELLGRSDIVSIHASHLGTRSLFLGDSEILQMKQGAWLINMARGDMCDDEALHRAVASNRLSGAGLDVYPNEPYSGPLCENKRVILSPHQATLAVETRVAMETHAVKNLLDYLQHLI